MLTSTRNRQHRRYHGLIFNPAPENRPLFRFLRFYMRADIKTNIADSLQFIIQLERRPGRRFISEVVVIQGYDPEADRYAFNPIYSCEEDYADVRP